MKKIVLINGGRGAKEIIPFLEKKKYKIISIVNAYDDGKSTGVLRDYFNTLGPSDLRKVMQLMIDKNIKNYNFIINLFECRLPKINNKYILEELDKLINYNENKIFNLNNLSKTISNYIVHKLIFFLKLYNRYKKNNKIDLILSDMSLINCIIVSLIFEKNQQIDKALKDLKTTFKIKSKILINSNSIKHLVALRRSGKFLNSEAEIVETRSNVKISRIFLLDKKIKLNLFKNKNYIQKKLILDNLNNVPKLSRSSFDALTSADIIIFCPGTQHSSLYPTYMSLDFKKAIETNNKAKKIFITNIGADYETPKYDSFDYLNGAYNYITNFDNKKKYSKYFDVVIINKAKFKSKINYVKFNSKPFKENSIKYIYEDFENKYKPGYHDFKKIYKYIK
tara:strand:- start:9176 stop:10357 length:1182 start_codon:yes stop_codon:yes gene_type:complete